MFNSTAGLYPLDASNAPLPTCANQQCLQHCQMASGRQSCHQLRTTDELEALAGLPGAALEQGDRALPGAGCPRVLLWPPSSCCPPHRVRSPRSQGDMPPWSNPTLLDHVLSSRAHEDLLLVLPADGVCKPSLRGGPACRLSGEQGILDVPTMCFGHKHAHKAPPMKDGGGGGRRRVVGYGQGPPLESCAISLQMFGWPLQTPAAGVAGGRCGRRSHIFDPST